MTNQTVYCFDYLLKTCKTDDCLNYQKHNKGGGKITGRSFDTSTFPDWLCVIDIDCRKDNNEAVEKIKELEEKMKDKAVTIVKSPNGGLHIYTKRSRTDGRKKIKEYTLSNLFEVDMFYKTPKFGRLVIPPSIIKTKDGEKRRYTFLQDNGIYTTEQEVIELLGFEKKKTHETVEKSKEVDYQALKDCPGTVFFLNCWISSKVLIHNWCEYSEQEQQELSLHSLFSRARYVYARECEIYKRKIDLSKLYSHLLKIQKLLNLTDNAALSYVYRMKYNDKVNIATPSRFIQFPQLLLKYSGWLGYSDMYNKFIKKHERLREIFEEIPNRIYIPDRIDRIDLQKFGTADLSKIILEDFNDIHTCLSRLSSCVRMERKSGDWFVSESGEVWCWKDSRLRKELMHIKTRFKERRKLLSIWEIVYKFHHLLECDNVKFYSEQVEDISIFKSYRIEAQENKELEGIFINFVKDLTASEYGNIWNELLKWCAYIIQNPAGMTGTVPILVGRQGCGKSTFTNILFKLLSPYSEKLNTLATISSNFTGNLEGKKLIQIEELENVSEFSSNVENRLKGYITDNTICIEKKGLERYTAESVCNFIGTSNYAIPVRISSHDRRFWIVKCSSEKINEREYWNKLYQVFDTPAFLPAVMYLLKNIDLTDYNHTIVPKTVGNEIVKECRKEDPAEFLLWQYIEEFEQYKDAWVLAKNKIANVKALVFSDLCAIERRTIKGVRGMYIILTNETYNSIRRRFG